MFECATYLNSVLFLVLIPIVTVVNVNIHSCYDYNPIDAQVQLSNLNQPTSAFIPTWKAEHLNYVRAALVEDCD